MSIFLRITTNVFPPENGYRYFIYQVYLQNQLKAEHRS